MLGAIAGDIIGSTYEFIDMKEYDFELCPLNSFFTDDTVMTIAVAHWRGHKALIIVQNAYGLCKKRVF